MLTVGRTAPHARSLMHRALVNLVSYYVATFMFFAIGLALYSLDIKAWVYLVGVGAVVFILTYVPAKKHKKQYFLAKAGVDAENQVASEVHKGKTGVKPEVLVNSFYTGKGSDVDHVLFYTGSNGSKIVCVETKNGFGKVFVDKKTGNLKVLGRNIKTIKAAGGSPVNQVVKASAFLKNLFRAIPVYTVVCVPGMNNKPFKVGETAVCSSKDLLRVAQSFSYGKPGVSKEVFVKAVEKHGRK